MPKKMQEIKGLSKAKRLKWDAVQNQISWAYLKELREHNDTRKVLDINPYIEVYQFRKNLYSLFHPNCDGMGDVWMHLIIGPEKAMLIDTGYGLGDIKGLVEELTGGKELIVVNTHDHFDHAYGNCRFGKVYCSEYNVPYLESQHAHMWDYLFDCFGDNIWLTFDRKDLPVFKKYEIVGVPDGYTWNLGEDYEVELIFTGGHSAGHAAYLDKKNRILFTGDNICSDVSACGNAGRSRKAGPYQEYTHLEFYRERVKYLTERIKEYDYIFPSHIMVNLENSLMYDILEAVDCILEDPKKHYDYKTEVWGKDRTVCNLSYFKYIKGFSVIKYQCKE